MVMIWSLIGALLAAVGIILFRRQRKLVGTLFIIIGGSLVILGVIALLSFHP